MARPRVPGAAAAVVGVVALLWQGGCVSAPPRHDENGTASVVSGYVGVKACEPCHAEIAASYSATGMSRGFHPLAADNLVEDFAAQNRLDLPEDRLAYEMSSRDGRYFMRQIVLDDRQREIASYEREILYVVGSGNHSRAYLTGEEGYLYQMPVCWYPQKPGWDLCPGYEWNNLFFMREADGDCLFCHNARVPLVERSTHRYGAGMPHGVDCERCHGPGAEHVAYWKSPPEVMPDRDPTIVNPRRLEPEARIHVCMQCHLGESVSTVRVKRSGRDPRDYRPGEDLLDYIDPITFEEPIEDLFGLSSQADRLLLSRCSKESGGGLDCLTCHNPHSSVYAIADRASHFRAACIRCHAPAACALEESERRRRSPGDDCAGCHMRRSEPADHRFSAFTDHWIRRRPDPPGPPDLRRASLGLAPVFPGGHVALAPGEADFNMGFAYARMKQSHPTASAIPWSAAEERLRAAVKADPSRGDAWYHLGKVVLERGKAAEALGHFRETLRLDPTHFEARKEMGSILLDLGRNSEAVETLREAVRLRGDDMKSLTNLGRALVESGDEAEAERIFRLAAKTAPAHSTPLANLGLLAERQGRHEEAATFLREAVAREPSRPEIWEALAASLAQAGFLAESEAAARHARWIRGT